MNSTPLAGSGDSDSDDEMDWEEVSVPVVAAAAAVSEELASSNYAEAAGRTENIEITIRTANKKVDPNRKKQAEQNAELRALRLACHKIHTVALLSNALTRNKWINDPLLHARLLSLTPLPLQTSFAMITKKRHPDAAKRGRLFETSLMRLTQWWYESFRVINRGHIRSRTFDQVQNILFNADYDDDEGELVKNSKSLMKHAVNSQGSRDVSAQLFTALCRALGIPARLVVSIQSVPWQANVGNPKALSKKRSKKGKEKEDTSFDDEMKRSDADTEGASDDYSDMEEISIPGRVDVNGKGKMDLSGEGVSHACTSSLKGLEKALPKPIVKLRRSKSSGQKLGSSSISRQSTPAPFVGGYPPVFWTEVFSRPDGKWMPVDPVRYIVNKRKVFEPLPHYKDNRMTYVVAVEEDGYCRDVTPRYAKDYGTKTRKAQLSGKGRKDWWEGIMALVTRPYRLVRDDVEDEEFESNKYSEGMPTSVVGFKDHPLYVLEQHLKREEVIFPKTEIGKFRGEAVYPRSNVIPLKTADNWMRMGRRIKEGAQAMKWVKQRAVTIHRRRAMELAQQEGDEMLQGLYSEDQTELYVPEPIIDGVIPKNDFGNIDLYTPSMLPKGAVHVPYKGAAKVAKKLGFDYAEAVSSFEFKKGRAFPVISGIVIASENEETLLEAYWEAEREAEDKKHKKQKENVIKRWTKLIQGLRIRQRLQEQYANGGEPSKSALLHNDGRKAAEIEEEPGGFLIEADAIVQPFHLPRFEHGTHQPFSSAVEETAKRDNVSNEIMGRSEADQPKGALPSMSTNFEEEPDDDFEEIVPVIDKNYESSMGNGGPKTMRELAEASGGSTQTLQTTMSAAATATPGKQPEGRVTRSMGRWSSQPTTAAKTTLIKNGSSSKATILKRSRATRKRRALPDESDDDVVTDNDGSVEPVDEVDEDSSDNGQSSRKQSKTTRPNLKRQRSNLAPVIPSPSTRHLRARVPKSAEKIKAEREAEEAYRRAIAE